MKKILILFLLWISLFSYSTSLFWNEEIKEDNIIIEAFSERKTKLLEIVNWWKLETEINVLKTRLENLTVWNWLNAWTKDKLLNDISKLEDELVSINTEITSTVENSTEFEDLLESYNNEIILKKELVDQLNIEIKDNEINQEKITLLLDKYIVEKNKLEKTKTEQIYLKTYIFLFFTLWTLLIYLISTFLARKWKINLKKLIYINFFLLFVYIIFLIWYFFYLYPELSIFLIFISWYLLVINAHLVSSFFWSVVVLQRFKIWDIIKFWDINWQITRISPLYIILTPLTKEWIYKEKPIYIPHINILKENVTKDITADTFIHKFEITIKEDSWIDVMKFIDDIENNILSKFLHNRLTNINWIKDFFRISFDRTNFWHLVVVFVWKWDDLLNKKVERKIIWFFNRLSREIKKEKEKIEEEKKNS